MCLSSLGLKQLIEQEENMERPKFDLIKGVEKVGNVLPFKGRQAKMVIAEGVDGLTHLVPEEKVQPELSGFASVTMLPRVPYEVMGVTGMENEPFDPTPDPAA